MSIQIEAVNDAPVIETIGHQTVNENSELRFTVIGSDVDGDELTYSVSEIPYRASFDDATFTWTPAFDQEGSYSFTVYVTDGELTAQQEVTIEVLNTPVSAKVLMYDEALSNQAASNPRMYVENVSDQTISDFRLEYYFSAEDGKQPQLDLYYTADATVTLADRGDGDYTIVYDFSGIELAPGAVYPNYGGMVVGISYEDWGSVDVSDDYSNNQATSFTQNDRICIYNSDNKLLGGLEPAKTSILPVADAGDDIWSTDSRVALNASGSYALSGDIVKYEWTIDGVLVSEDASPELSFDPGYTSVALKVTNDKGLSSTDNVNVYVHEETSVFFATDTKPVPQNTPVTVEYNVPEGLAGCSIQLIGHSEWGNTTLHLDGSAGYHKTQAWELSSDSFGGSGPWTVDCKVNGEVTQSLTIQFE